MFHQIIKIIIVIKTPAEKLSKQTPKEGQASVTSLSSDKISKGILKLNNKDTCKLL